MQDAIQRDFQLFPDAASSIAPKTDSLHLFLVIVSLIAASLIALAIVVFCVRYRRRAGVASDTSITGSTQLELIWGGVPLFFSLIFFGWGAKLYIEIRDMPAEGMRFNVTGKQWMWKLQHPTGQREINTLHVPVDTNILLTMISEDVIHDFYVPAFRIKYDVLPGRYTRAWFRPTKPGRYHLFCAEYCGTEHSAMGGEVVVMEEQDYQQWLSGAPAALDPVEGGRALFEQLRCNTCHDAGPGQRGPVLAGLHGAPRVFESGETLVADDAYIRESILEPQRHVVAGYQPLMPTYKGQASEDDILQLIAYIRSLGPQAKEDAR